MKKSEIRQLAEDLKFYLSEDMEIDHSVNECVDIINYILSNLEDDKNDPDPEDMIA